MPRMHLSACVRRARPRTVDLLRQRRRVCTSSAKVNDARISHGYFCSVEHLPLANGALRVGSMRLCGGIGVRYRSLGSNVNVADSTGYDGLPSMAISCSLSTGTSRRFRHCPGSKGHAAVEGRAGSKYSTSPSKIYCSDNGEQRP